MNTTAKPTAVLGSLRRIELWLKNQRFRRVMMNKWLRGIVFLAPVVSVSAANALCDSEHENYMKVTNTPSDVSVRSRTLHAEEGKQCFARDSMINFGNLDYKRNTSLPNIKAGIRELEALPRPNLQSRVTLARLILEKCKIEVLLAGCATNSNNQSGQQQSQQNQAAQQQTQQSQQQNQAAQQQSQQAQQQMQNAVFNTLSTQTAVDQTRKAERRRHEPENEASHCIQPDFGGLYGGMKNTCDFKVWYTYCGYRPKENSWLTGMSCEKQSFGSDSVSPGRTSASHTKGVEMLYWIACKEPAWTVDTEFVPGQGVRGRCYTVGGK
jgi:hypothetical protein